MKAEIPSVYVVADLGAVCDKVQSALESFEFRENDHPACKEVLNKLRAVEVEISKIYDRENNRINTFYDNIG